MSTDDRDTRLDELLRTALRDEANTVNPAGDGLSRIQQRVTSRRVRHRWFRPALATGTALAVVAIGFGTWALTNGGGGTSTVKVVTPATTGTIQPSETPTSTPTPTNTATPTTGFPTAAIFPFTNTTDEKAWELEYANGNTPQWSDPVGVATSWVDNYLGFSSVSDVVSKTVHGGAATVTLGRTMTDGATSSVHAVTTVSLVQYGHAWLITGVADAGNLLAFTSPSADATVSSPLTVTGPGYGADEAATVEVRDGLSNGPALGTAHTGSFGNGTPQWSATVTYTTPAAAVGVVVAYEDSAADGGVSRLAAEQVRFATNTAPSYPDSFIGIQAGRVARFGSQTGQFAGYISDATPGGGASDPQLYPNNVYWLQGNGTCSNQLMELTLNAPGTPHVVTASDSGDVISGYAVGPDQTVVSFYERACSGGNVGGSGKLVTKNLATGGGTHAIDFPSEPPLIIGDPTFESSNAGQGPLDAFVRTGNEGYLAQYDVMDNTATSPTPSTNACSGYDTSNGMPAALEYHGGALWFAVGTGSSMQVYSCTGKTATLVFTVPGQDQPADLDVASTGQGVLLTDQTGKVWLWSGGTKATQLDGSTQSAGVTW